MSATTAGEGSNGNASGTGLATGAAAVLWGPQLFGYDDTVPWQVSVRVHSDQAFTLYLEVFDGTNWFSMDSVASASLTNAPDITGTAAHGSQANVALKTWKCPYNGRVVLKNTGGVSSSYGADIRIERGS